MTSYTSILHIGKSVTHIGKRQDLQKLLGIQNPHSEQSTSKSNTSMCQNSDWHGRYKYTCREGKEKN